MLEDRTHPNHPSPTRATLQREEEREAEALDKIAFAKTLVPLREQWAELKNKLAALIQQTAPPGHREHGWRIACLEDADDSVLMILDGAEGDP